MFEEFLRICTELNRAGIVPLLFGSLGLERSMGMSFDPKDIDMLVPERFLDEEWGVLRGVAESLGYELSDLHEHEFSNSYHKIAFAGIEGLEPFVGIRMNEIAMVGETGRSYLLLDPAQYLKVYERSAQDGYRRGKNHGRDDHKIMCIRAYLETEEKQQVLAEVYDKLATAERQNEDGLFLYAEEVFNKLRVKYGMKPAIQNISMDFAEVSLEGNSSQDH